MENKVELVEGVLHAVVRVAGQYSDHGYALMILDSLREKLVIKHPFMRHISVRTTPYAGGHRDIAVDAGIEDVPVEDIIAGLDELVKRITTPIRGSDHRHFTIQVRGYLGTDLETKLKTLGITSLFEE